MLQSGKRILFLQVPVNPILHLLSWGHCVLLIVSGPITLIFDLMLFSLVPEVDLGSFRSVCSVVMQPLFCFFFLAGLVLINKSIRNCFELQLMHEENAVLGTSSGDMVQGAKGPSDAQQAAHEGQGLLEV